MVNKQYQVVLVDLNPSIGSEMNKVRPSVILSPIELNANLKTVIVAPMTMTDKKYPTRIKVKSGSNIGYVAIDQIRTIDSRRIVKEFKTLTNAEIKAVKLVIKETLVD